MKSAAVAVDAVSGGPRDNAFDLLKGILVLVMVAYHAMSILSSASVEDFRYLRFVSGSFIFVSGFVLTRFFATSFERDGKAASARLLVRGLKVLALFTVLNLMIQLTGVGNVNKHQFGHEGYWQHAASIYLQGNGRMSSFLILLPIGYLLMVTPAVLLLLSKAPPGLGLALLASTLALAAWPAFTHQAPNLEFMLIGLSGLYMGALRPADLPLHRFMTNTVLAPWRPSTALAGLVLAIWFNGHFTDNLAAYIVGIAALIKCTYDLAPLMSNSRPLRVGLALLGRYSLAAYIVQIVVIQLLFRLLHHERRPLGMEMLLLGLAIAAGLVGICLLLDHLRVRWHAVDRSYRLIFS